MKAKLIFLSGSIILVLSAFSAAGEGLPVFTNAKQVLDQFTESRKDLNSFIVKARTDSTFTYPEFNGVGVNHANSEFRYDGNRVKNIAYNWGDIGVRDRDVKEEDAHYVMNLWNGETAYSFTKSETHNKGKGTVRISEKGDGNPRSYSRIAPESFKQTHFGGVMGYPMGETAPIGELFSRPSTKLGLRRERGNVNGVDCYVVEADVPEHGKFTVWIDPVHDFHIARVRVLRESGDHFYTQVLKKTAVRKELYEVLEFEKQGDAWFPKTCKIKKDYKSDTYQHQTEKKVTFTMINLNPDHDALGSFLPDDITNGCDVRLLSLPSTVKFTWQDGELIPNVDQSVIDEIDKMADDILANADANVPPAMKDPVPDSLAVSELLGKYAATQNKLRSFIAKAESKIEYVRLGLSGRTEKQNCEFRLDSNRVCHRSFTLPGKTDYRSFLWDGKSCIQYRQSSQLTDGWVYVEKNDQNKKRLVSTEYKGAALIGICAGDYDRIDSILRKADKISLKKETEQVGDSQCYVVEGVTKRGVYKVWIDPEHGYTIAKIEARKSKGDLIRGGGRVKTGTSFSLKNVRFEKIDDIWVPMEADMEHAEDNGAKTTKWHHKRTQMTLNPDRNVLGSFVPDDIPNGAKVHIAGNAGKYIWQDGRPIAEVGGNVKR